MTQIQSLQSEGKQRSPTPPGGQQSQPNKAKGVPTPPNGLIENAQVGLLGGLRAGIVRAYGQV